MRFIIMLEGEKNHKNSDNFIFFLWVCGKIPVSI